MSAWGWRAQWNQEWSGHQCRSGVSGQSHSVRSLGSEGTSAGVQMGTHLCLHQQPHQEWEAGPVKVKAGNRGGEGDSERVDNRSFGSSGSVFLTELLDHHCHRHHQSKTTQAKPWRCILRPPKSYGSTPAQEKLNSAQSRSERELNIRWVMIYTVI